MKDPKWSWQDFRYGFWGAAIVLLAVVACLWGMAVAEKNTRAIGFGESMALGIIEIPVAYARLMRDGVCL